jgi:transcription termination factor Rho
MTDDRNQNRSDRGSSRRGGRRRGGRNSSRGRGRGPEQGRKRASGPPRRPEGEPEMAVGGIFHADNSGGGYLRSPVSNYEPAPGDPYIPENIVRELELIDGAEVAGQAIPPSSGQQTPWLEAIELVGRVKPEQWKARVPFKGLMAEDPAVRIRLEHDKDEISTRVLDIVTPIGHGQRCLIVAPPKAGKTVLLQKIAAAVIANHPEIHLIVLLVDERPEEVTDMRRNVQGEVVASSSDESAENHIRVSEMALDRAKRLVETGHDVMILMDSITRMSRAYNNQQKGSGRVLSGGIDARTMEKPRKFFGAARNVVDGGSLTVIGTALVDTGSRMDEVIFQEFKGTGNTEVVMDRDLFDKRIFPAIDITASGTRKEEKLFTEAEYTHVTLLRRALASSRSAEAMQLMIERISRYETNAMFLKGLRSS